MQANESSRKPAKGKGIDPDAARRNREGRAVQIRKEKRFDRANIERRKFKTDDTPSESMDPVVSSSGSTSRSYTVLPQKCSLLNSTSLQEQLDGAMFFRRILAADKNPPLDVVIESGMVVPTLVRFLSRVDSSALQSEAAWCLTNIACGEPRHIHNLLACGALPELLNVVTAPTSSMPLKDQALWAICNMTSTVEACEYALSMPNFMVVVLQQIGLQCEIRGPEGQRTGSFTTPHCILQRIVQYEVKDIPTLSTMRHVAFICGNIARMKKELSFDWYKMMLTALSELVHSPDDEIVMDICACLITLLQDHPDLSSLILELGFVSKLRENLEASHATPAVYELSLLVLCAILRGNSILHRTVVLKLGNRQGSSSGHNNSNSSGVNGGSSSVSVQPARAPASAANSPLNNSIFGTSSTTNNRPMLGNGIFDYHLPTSIPPTTTSNMDTSNAFGGIFDYHAPAEVVLVKPTSYQPGNVVTHIIYHLCRTENALTKSDLCRALVCTMDFGGSCANDCFAFGLLGALQGVLLVGSHDLTVDAGDVLCAALLSDGVQLTELLSNQCMKLLLELFETADLNLLSSVISAVKVLFTQAMMKQYSITQVHVVSDKVDELLVHPNMQIADLASSLEDLVCCYQGEEVGTDDDEEY